MKTLIIKHSVSDSAIDWLKASVDKVRSDAFNIIPKMEGS